MNKKIRIIESVMSKNFFLIYMVLLFLLYSCKSSREDDRPISASGDTRLIIELYNEFKAKLKSAQEQIPDSEVQEKARIYNLILIDNLEVLEGNYENFKVKYTYEIGCTDGYDHEYVFFALRNEDIIFSNKINEKTGSVSFYFSSSDAVSFLFQGLITEIDENGHHQTQLKYVSSSYDFWTSEFGADCVKIYPIDIDVALENQINSLTMDMLGRK
jgi:hypothetical protein